MSKLDALCAIKVMGWKQEWQPVPMMDHPGRPVGVMWWRGEMNWPRYAEIKQTTDSMCNMVPDKNLLLASPWKPSTDLNDALVCLERAANEVSKGFGFSIEKFPDDKWDARVFNGCTAQAFANADSAPLAMCICSLRAIGVPESEIQEALA